MTGVIPDRTSYWAGRVSRNRASRNNSMDRARRARAAGDPASVVRLWVFNARMASQSLVVSLRGLRKVVRR